MLRPALRNATNELALVWWRVRLSRSLLTFDSEKQQESVPGSGKISDREVFTTNASEMVCRSHLPNPPPIFHP
jgi:hypothetical protein